MPPSEDRGSQFVNESPKAGVRPPRTDRPSRMARALPRIPFNGVWCFRDDRLREFRQCENPHERITFDELLSCVCGSRLDCPAADSVIATVAVRAPRET